MRARFFGPESSTSHVTERLVAEHSRVPLGERRHPRRARRSSGSSPSTPAQIELVIHTAAQPSHDWAASEPQTDFGVNANGTLNLLEAARAHAPDAPFIFCSTNKVYGDTPNRLPLDRLEKRLELPEYHPYFEGIDTSMSIDASTHSLFGVSKAAADLLVQEYGRYFEMPTVCFRGGCLTGPQHAGAKLHGFLAYLMKCTVTGTPYTVFGYEGKQVRDNIHSADLIAAFDAFRRRPRAARGLQHRRRPLQQLLDAGGDRGLRADRRPRARAGRWARSRGSATTAGGSPTWRPFEADYPDWKLRYGVEDDPARDVRAEPRALDGERGMKLSVVMPAQNEEGSVGATVEGVVAALEREQIDYEIVVVNDDSEDSTEAVVEAIGASQPARALPPLPLRARLRDGDPGRPRRLRGRRGGDRHGRRLRRPRGPGPLPPAARRRAGTAPSARASCRAPRSTTTRG